MLAKAKSNLLGKQATTDYAELNDTNRLLQISRLQSRRRERFTYVDPEKKTGELTRRGILMFTLSTLAGCLGTPVLFYISFHALRIYSNAGVTLQALLPDLFFGATLTLLLDIWLGFLYDKLIKAGYFKTRLVITIIGTLGMIACVVYLFNMENITVEDALVQFRWGMMGLTISYTLTNATAFKDSTSFTPVYERRVRLFQYEYILKFVVTLGYVCFPYWLKFFSDECNCGDICGTSPETRECNTCINGCDRSRTGGFYYYTTIVFVCLFAIITIASDFIVEPRTDEREEGVPPSFNRRLGEILRNKLFIKTLAVTFLEFFIFYGLAFWMNFWLNNQTAATVQCSMKYGSSFYFCTKSWLKQITFLIVIVVSVIVYFVSMKWDLIKQAMSEWAMITALAGVLLIFIDTNQTVAYIITAVLIGVFFTTIPLNKVIYTDSMFYDEYITGNSQPYLLSVLFLCAEKFGFFACLAFQIVFLNGRYALNGAEDKTSDGLGALFIVATILIYIINKFIAKHDLQNFDNIQLAIERNLDSRATKEITFLDPVTGEPIKTPVFAGKGKNADLIALFYNLDPKGDLKLAIHGQHNQLKKKALIRIAILGAIIAVCVALLVVFWDYLDTNWGWFLFFDMLTIVVCFYATLYNFYVWKTADALGAMHKELHHAKTIKKFGRLADETVSSEEESSEEEGDHGHEHEHEHDEEAQPMIQAEDKKDL